MKKELGIFIGLFLFLSIGMHFKQWLDHPIEHMMNMQDGGAFGIPGIIHPIVFTFLLYFVIAIPRIFMKLSSKKK
jgi:hypothetical protein